ncbi:MAG: DUF4097 family beta strand repeat-containing protein [Bacteroidota bacterium]
MRTIITISLILLICGSVKAQRSIEENFELGGKQKLEMNFKWPKLVRVQNWEGQTVKITGEVLINNGENNDAFKLRSKVFDDQIVITSAIEKLDDLPKKIMIKRDGMKYYFNTGDWNDPEVKKFLGEKENGQHSYMTMGVIKEIQIDVYLPKGVEVVINAKYGLVEINTISNPINVDAKYGGIDMAFGTSQKNLEAKTRYGEIYSNLPFELESNRGDFHNDNKWTVVSYKGKSESAVLESKYGDVFLRQKRGG